MDENIVKQVGDIEAEADRILAEAKRRAADLEESLESEIEALRKEREEVLEGRLCELQQKLDEETTARLNEIEQGAREAMARLDSLDPQAVDGVVQLILEHLQGQSDDSIQGEQSASSTLEDGACQ